MSKKIVIKTTVRTLIYLTLCVFAIIAAIFLQNPIYWGLKAPMLEKSAKHIFYPIEYSPKVEAFVKFEPNNTGYRLIRLYQNGSIIDRTTSSTQGLGIATSVSSQIIVYCDSGDYLSVFAEQTSGGALNVLTNESHFIVNRIDG